MAKTGKTLHMGNRTLLVLVIYDIANYRVVVTL